MPLYLNTNISSLRARRNLGKVTGGLDNSFKRLASGLRINSAKDDAAGLQISDRMTAQINPSSRKFLCLHIFCRHISLYKSL